MDPHVQWRMRNWTKSENEREIFRKITIYEEGEHNNDNEEIWVMRGENVLGALANNTFQVWAEQDINTIDWNSGFFR